LQVIALFGPVLAVSALTRYKEVEEGERLKGCVAIEGFGRV
jgi:hypothetical protein